MVLLDPRELGISIEKTPMSVLAFSTIFVIDPKRRKFGSRICTFVIREVCAATTCATPSGGGTSSLDIIATGVVSGEECQKSFMRLENLLKSCPKPAGSKKFIINIFRPYLEHKNIE